MGNTRKEPIQINGELKLDMKLLTELMNDADGCMTLADMLDFLHTNEVPMTEPVRKLGYALGVFWTWEDLLDDQICKRACEELNRMEMERYKEMI